MKEYLTRDLQKNNLHRRNPPQRLWLVLAPIIPVPYLEVVNHCCDVTLGRLFKEGIRDLMNALSGPSFYSTQKLLILALFGV